ncbi:MAG: glutaminyl-peptide cyclotransferase [Bacteroidales bacterium]|nr:glutaminyl-peptide cyclotransferase [Bacteroidales bacterium]
MRRLIYILVVLIFFIVSCSNNKSNKDTNSNLVENVNSKSNADELNIEFKILNENKSDKHKIGEILKFSIENKDTIEIDSVKFYVNNNLIETKNELPAVIDWNSIDSRVGRIDFKVRTFYKTGNSTSKLSVTMLSDIIPKEYSYKVINTFNHDRAAYTQGLVYLDGFLYEATGQRGESTLRKVQLASGDVIQSFTIAPEIFGEGITIFKDKIIQLSWQSYTGFIYDKESFKLLMKFNYQTEGWGLTDNENNLIMSDGTNKLYFLDTESYSQVDKLEVYDNKTFVKSLNELEYINGEIYANIYTTNKIAIIEAKTGKVKAYIDLSGILPQKDYEKSTDVLNGIAYDKKGDRLFVTGKYWPKLFQIKLIEKI